ncbi:MAG: hypothetical protein ACJAVM_003352 [Sulfitobacter sp.]
MSDRYRKPNNILPSFLINPAFTKSSPDEGGIMNLISAFSGGSNRTPPATGPQNGTQGNTTPEPEATPEDSNSPAQNAAAPAPSDPSTEVDNNNQAPAPRQETQTAGNGASTPEAQPPVSRTPETSSKATEISIEADRRAAEQRIEQSRTRALIDSIAPVANSPTASSKSYLQTLLNTDNANVARGQTSAAAPPTEAAA